MSEHMPFSKKEHWQRGRFAFKIKVFTPEGGMMEMTLPRVPKDIGDAILKAVTVELNRKP